MVSPPLLTYFCSNHHLPQQVLLRDQRELLFPVKWGRKSSISLPFFNTRNGKTFLFFFFPLYLIFTFPVSLLFLVLPFSCLPFPLGFCISLFFFHVVFGISLFPFTSGISLLLFCPYWWPQQFQLVTKANPAQYMKNVRTFFSHK